MNYEYRTEKNKNIEKLNKKKINEKKNLRWKREIKTGEKILKDHSDIEENKK